PEPEPERGIFAFSRGPRAGDCLHSIFEKIDFRAVETPVAEATVRDVLRRFRLHEARHHARGNGVPPAFEPPAAVLEMLRAVMTSPLPGERFRLGQIGRSKRLVEWQFYTPMMAGGAAPDAPVETPAAAELDLAGLFRRHARAPWGKAYAERLAALDGATSRGFLTGFVDLVFEHGGRWFVVDWKSNYLGPTADSYGLDAMTSAMVEHHYLLQYHLYVAALDRYLAERLAGWDYERGFGGVFYVFLRGVEPGGEAAQGRSTGSLVGTDDPGSETQPAAEPGQQLHLFESPRAAVASHRRPSAAGRGSTGSSRGREIPGIFADCPPKALVKAIGQHFLGPVEVTR
ncbi:MAG: PD-(D/E)XK nuclease family protein, partial [Holophagales bacterium]|nr:PD-(D/E)XK nuclease family protein [Holophagales bacterium]